MAIPSWLYISQTAGTSGTTVITVSAGTNFDLTKTASIVVNNTGNSSIFSSIYIEEDKMDYSQMYFTIDVLSNGLFYLYASDSSFTKTIQYSIDNGSTWTSLTSVKSSSPPVGNSFMAYTGDKILLKGNNKQYARMKNNQLSYNKINFGGNCNVYGNIMSLIDGDNFSNRTELDSGYTFCYFFSGMKLIDASNLVLPATTLKDNCYRYMFQSCSGLTTAPELPATTLTDGCYYAMFWRCSSLTTAPVLPATTLVKTSIFYGCYEMMFYECTSLNYIKCLATSINDATRDWVYGVSSTGTFVKDASMTGWTTGIDGIPSGWTVISE